MNVDMFRISPETNMVLKRITETTDGDFISYSELSSLIGGDIQNEKRHHLDSARKIAKDEGIVFGVIINKGIKRLNDQEKVQEGYRGIEQVRRKAIKSAKTLACVENFDLLSTELQIKHNTTLSVLGAVNLFSKTSEIKKVAEAVRNKNSQLLVGETMRLFSGSRHE